MRRLLLAKMASLRPTNLRIAKMHTYKCLEHFGPKGLPESFPALAWRCICVL